MRAGIGIATCTEILFQISRISDKLVSMENSIKGKNFQNDN